MGTKATFQPRLEVVQIVVRKISTEDQSQIEQRFLPLSNMMDHRIWIPIFMMINNKPRLRIFV